MCIHVRVIFIKLLVSLRLFVLIFPIDCSGKILDVEVVDGGPICSSGVHVEEMLRK